MEVDKEALEVSSESSTNSQSEVILDNYQDNVLMNTKQDEDVSKAKSMLEININELHNRNRIFDKTSCSSAMDEEAASADDVNMCNNFTTEESGMEFDTDKIITADDLRQFDVLDDLERHSDQNCSDMDSDTNESMDSDVPDEEIEAMLEEGEF